MACVFCVCPRVARGRALLLSEWCSVCRWTRVCPSIDGHLVVPTFAIVTRAAVDTCMYRFCEDLFHFSWACAWEWSF